ncbi:MULTISPECIES: signal peptidase I [unclassified Adlercreutzia]|uniref:signal peptidase I n=1 Tax=unclassified Adlercreutzia TaxID=2636013 RepID=UPI0013ED09D5|nr:MULTISPECIES: signal peptidase I [unclassified Adlercreutzia]
MYSGQHADAHKPSIGRRLVSLLGMVALIVALSWGLRTYVFQAYEIPSGSMEETIMTGDMVFSEKVSYYLGEPERGDIVTFADPEIPSRVLIKRVIATAGETVELIDGRVVVDGVALVEPYTRNLPSYPLTPAYGEDVTYPYTVGEGELWVMGDNRTNSQDSRYFGAIDASTVTGKAVLTYWPLSRFGLLSSEG